MRILPEFFWTSQRYREIRSHILACLFTLSGGMLMNFLPTPIWINVLVGIAIYGMVIFLREKAIL